MSAVEVGLSGQEEFSDKAEKYYNEMTGAPLLDEADRAARAEGIELRSHLVVCEFRLKSVFLEVGFGVTPLLKAFYMLRSWIMTVECRDGRHFMRIFLVLDVSRAYFYALPTREAYIELPPEDAEESMVDGS